MLPIAASNSFMLGFCATLTISTGTRLSCPLADTFSKRARVLGTIHAKSSGGGGGGVFAAAAVVVVVVIESACLRSWGTRRSIGTFDSVWPEG